MTAPALICSILDLFLAFPSFPEAIVHLKQAKLEEPSKRESTLLPLTYSPPHTANPSRNFRLQEKHGMSKSDLVVGFVASLHVLRPSSAEGKTGRSHNMTSIPFFPPTPLLNVLLFDQTN